VDALFAGVAVNDHARKLLVRKVLEAALAEGVLEELPQSVSEQVLQNHALGRPLDEGVSQAAVLGTMAGGMMGGGGTFVAGVARKPSPTAQGGAPAPAPTPAPVAPAVTPADVMAAPSVDAAIETLMAGVKQTTAAAEADALGKLEAQARADEEAVRQRDPLKLPRKEPTAPALPTLDEVIQGGDLLTPKTGAPFTEAAAKLKQKALRQDGKDAELIPVAEGGFIVRPIKKGAPNAQVPDLAGGAGGVQPVGPGVGGDAVRGGGTPAPAAAAPGPAAPAAGAGQPVPPAPGPAAVGAADQPAAPAAPGMVFAPAGDGRAPAAPAPGPAAGDLRGQGRADPGGLGAAGPGAAPADGGVAPGFRDPTPRERDSHGAMAALDLPEATVLIDRDRSNGAYIAGKDGSVKWVVRRGDKRSNVLHRHNLKDWPASIPEALRGPLLDYVDAAADAPAGQREETPAMAAAREALKAAAEKDDAPQAKAPAAPAPTPAPAAPVPAPAGEPAADNAAAPVAPAPAGGSQDERDALTAQWRELEAQIQKATDAGEKYQGLRFKQLAIEKELGGKPEPEAAAPAPTSAPAPAEPKGRVKGQVVETLTLPDKKRPQGVPFAEIRVEKFEDGFSAAYSWNVPVGGEASPPPPTRHASMSDAVRAAVDAIRKGVRSVLEGKGAWASASDTDRATARQIMEWALKQHPAAKDLLPEPATTPAPSPAPAPAAKLTRAEIIDMLRNGNVVIGPFKVRIEQTPGGRYKANVTAPGFNTVIETPHTMDAIGPVAFYERVADRLMEMQREAPAPAPNPDQPRDEETGQFTAEAPAPSPAPAADGKSRAAAGGQEGINGYFYKGGQFLPSTMAEPGKWKVDGKWVNSGREQVGPNDWSHQPTPFSRAIYSFIGAWTEPKDGKLSLRQGIRDNVGNPVTPQTEIRPGVKGVLGKEALTLQEFIDAWNAGQRWFDVKPDAATVTTDAAAPAPAPAEDDSTALPAPGEDGEAWWKSLTPAGRRKVQAEAGVRENPLHTWGNMTEDMRASLLAAGRRLTDAPPQQDAANDRDRQLLNKRKLALQSLLACVKG
jgi:hypothetical protein